MHAKPIPACLFQILAWQGSRSRCSAWMVAIFLDSFKSLLSPCNGVRDARTSGYPLRHEFHQRRSMIGITPGKSNKAIRKGGLSLYFLTISETCGTTHERNRMSKQ